MNLIENTGKYWNEYLITGDKKYLQQAYQCMMKYRKSGWFGDTRTEQRITQMYERVYGQETVN